MRTLKTERLILRDWKESDLEDYYTFCSDPNVTIPDGYLPMTLDNCKKVLDYMISAKSHYAIELKETGKVIGNIGLSEDILGNNNARNIGYVLAEEYWNNGYMTEALRAVIQNVNCILSATCYNNPKSVHILDKLGFTQESIIHDVKREIDNIEHDEPYYTLKRGNVDAY